MTIHDIKLDDALNIIDPFRQWMIGANEAGEVMSKAAWDGLATHTYNLKNTEPVKFLQFEEQAFGINLGWTDNASAQTAARRAKWFFARAGGQGPVRYGDTLAMGWGKNPSFIRHAKRDVGIDLDWSEKPVFEWMIFGGEPGSPVRTGGNRVMIFNTSHAQPLIFFNRSVGGDIGWPDSQTWTGAAKSFLKEEALSQVVAGVVKALGSK